MLAVFRSPKSDKTLFRDKMEAILSKLSSKNALVVGDFNENFLIEGPYVKTLLNTFLSYNLAPYVHEATRICTTTQTCIDQVFYDADSKDEALVEVIDPGYSDHHCQLISIPRYQTHTDSVIRRRNFSKKNVLKFEEQMKSEQWIEVCQCQNANDKMEKFISTLVGHFEKHFPFTEKKCKPKKSGKAWFTPGLNASRKMKMKLNEWQKEDTSGFIKDYFKKYTKIYKKVIAASKINCNSLRIERAENKCKEAWAVMREESGNAAKKETTELLINPDGGEKITEPRHIAQCFNDFFIDAPQKLLENMAVSSGPNFLPMSEEEMVFYPTDPEEVLSIILARKNKSSSGPDGLPEFLMKKVVHSYLLILTDIINDSMAQSIFPDCLKTAKVTPVHKKGSKTDVANYRPISNLSFFSKILESVVKNRLTGYLAAYSKLSPTQHGFMTGKSTITAMADYSWQICEAIDEKLTVIGLSLDQSRAFDCISFEILFKRLEQYGIRGEVNKWFQSYMLGRQQYVEVDGQKSLLRELLQGVIQGSILAPTLFILYIDSLAYEFSCEFSDEEMMVIYADDVNYMIKARRNAIQQKAQQVCKKIENWFLENRLVLNSSKSVAIDYSLRERTHPPEASVDVTLFGEVVDYKPHHNILGCFFDSGLRWDEQITRLSKKLNCALFLLRSLKYKLKPEQLKLVYFAKFHSLMSYGCAIWGQGCGSNVIFICQKKALRILNIKEREENGTPVSCRPLFKLFGILTFPCQYILNCVTLILKNGNKLPQFDNQYLTRNAGLFRLPLHSTSSYEKNVYYSASKFYNKLPPRIRMLETSKGKIAALKDYLEDQAFYSVEDFLNSPNT